MVNLPKTDENLMKYLSILAISLWMVACTQPPETTSSATMPPVQQAQTLVDAAIEVHGGDAYQGQWVSFDFRDRHYRALLDSGRFRYERHTPTEDGMVVDRLTNDGLIRMVDGEVVVLADTMADKYANSVNSVIYFALLPYFLNDGAVNKAYLGTSRLDSTDYHLIKVTFDQEGGGKDFDDEFLYWIHPETYRMPYMAYSYATDGGGLRFRSAYNLREVGGIRFQDYVNYKADHQQFELEQLDSLFRVGALEELSRIELESIEVVTE